MARSASSPDIVLNERDDPISPTLLEIPPLPPPKKTAGRRRSLPSRAFFLSSQVNSRPEPDLPPLPVRDPPKPLPPPPSNDASSEILVRRTKSLLSPPPPGKRKKNQASLFYMPTDSTVVEDEDYSGSGRSDASDSHNSPQPSSEHTRAPEYYIFAELLETEWHYLQDLNDLVHVYIRQLPQLKHRTSTLASLGSSAGLAKSTFTRTPSHKNVSRLPGSSPASPSSPKSASVSKEPQSSQMFTNNEIALLSRNIEQIRSFHEYLTSELRVSLLDSEYMTLASSADGPFPHAGLTVEIFKSAVERVCKKFARESHSFGMYKEFCSGHPAAFDLLRRAQVDYPSEIEAWEHRCAALISTKHRAKDIQHDYVASPASLSKENMRTRRLSVKGSLFSPSDRRQSFTSVGSPVRSNSDFHGELSFTGPRLMLMDYLIKPVQRICKYPLLLENLYKILSANAPKPEDPKLINVDVYVKRAWVAMKRVASTIDAARRHRELTNRSSLIVARVVQPPANLAISLPPSRIAHGLTLAFLFSLGLCRLAGSLDVMCYRPPVGVSGGVIKTRYFGAFLYDGGYLVLVKVTKSKTYEPRHWMSLKSVVIEDIPDDEAFMCSSIRLSYRGQRIDLSASCQKEKEVWLLAIKQAVAMPFSTINEPVSSLELDAVSSSHARDESLAESVPVLAPSMSMPSLDTPTAPPTVPASPSSTRRRRKSLIPDNAIVPPSRRSSIASVKAIFNPNVSSVTVESTLLIRRAAPAARLIVERGLLDVMTDKCLTARLYANSQNIQLWQTPVEPASPNFTLSFGVAAKNRLTKRDSVLVRAKSHRSTLDGMVDTARSSFGTEGGGDEQVVTLTGTPYLTAEPTPLHQLGFRSVSESALQTSPSLESAPQRSATTGSRTRLSVLTSRKSIRNMFGRKPNPASVELTFVDVTPEVSAGQSSKKGVLKRWTGSIRRATSKKRP